MEAAALEMLKSQGPLVLLAAALLWALIRDPPWLVPGWTYRKEVRDCEGWKSLALSNNKQASQATNLALAKHSCPPVSPRPRPTTRRSRHVRART